MAGSALAQTVVPVSSFSPTGWFTGYGDSGGGSSALSFSSVIDANGALRVKGDRTRAGLGNVFPSSSAGSLGSVSSLTRCSFDFAVASVGATVPTGQAPALRLIVWDPDQGASGRRVNITWEDGEQSAPQFVGNPSPVGAFNTAFTGDLFAPGSRVYPFTGGLGRGLFDAGGTMIPGSDAAVALSTLLAGLGANTVVTGIEIGVGSSVGAFDGFADHVRIAFGPSNDTLYDFGASPGAVSLNVADACTNSSMIEVTIDLDNPSNASVAGGQFFLQFDTTKLQYVGGTPSATFSTEIIDNQPQPNHIDYASGVPFGGAPVTATSARFATLMFNKLSDVCAADGLTLVSFRTPPSPFPPTRLSDQFSSPIPTTTTDLAPFTMDSTAPSITCPGNITVQADAGFCSAILNFTNDFSTSPVLSATQAPGVWYTDRFAPAGFASGPVPGGTGLVHSISSADSSANRPPAFVSTFYSTQGRKFDVDIPIGGTLGVDLYIPGSWATDIRRADIWGTGVDSSNAVSDFPIIGFTSFNSADMNGNAPSLPAQPRWRVWDSNNGAWIDLATPVTFDAWHRLEIEFTATQWVFKLDGAIVSTIPNLASSVRIANTILQAFNFGQSYDVFWDNLTFGPAGPVATDNCELSTSVTRSDNLALSDPFPTGTTTITWTATDCSGNSTSCTYTVTVNATSTFVASVELEGVTSGTFDRCITFDFFGATCPNPDATVSQTLTFVNGVATGSIDVPCGNYTCVTARDPRHTLRRTAALGTSGPNYTATFNGADALPGGNLNGDIFVDILDFGGFVGQFGVNYGTADTTCSTPFPHADISGNGVVGIEDFTFIQSNFLEFNEPNCCGNLIIAQPNSPGGPVTDISVVQLVADGNWDVARADVNHDGRLNVQDVARVLSTGLPACAADFNADQLVTAQDLFDFLGAYFAQHPAADINLDRNVSVQDIFDYLTVWFAGC